MIEAMDRVHYLAESVFALNSHLLEHLLVLVEYHLVFDTRSRHIFGLYSKVSGKTTLKQIGDPS